MHPLAEGFGRQLRLLNSRQFARVFAQPRRAADQYFTLLYRDSTLSHPRLGLAISKKALRRAAQRNRVKRLIRESFRHHQQQLCGLDVVVLAKRGLDTADNRALLAALDRLWTKLSAPGIHSSPD